MSPKDDEGQESWMARYERGETMGDLLDEAWERVRVLEEALRDAVEHMNRARTILRENSGGNWGMLDTTKHRALLSPAAATEGGEGA